MVAPNQKRKRPSTQPLTLHNFFSGAEGKNSTSSNLIDKEIIVIDSDSDDSPTVKRNCITPTSLDVVRVPLSRQPTTDTRNDPSDHERETDSETTDNELNARPCQLNHNASTPPSPCQVAESSLSILTHDVNASLSIDTGITNSCPDTDEWIIGESLDVEPIVENSPNFTGVSEKGSVTCPICNMSLSDMLQLPLVCVHNSLACMVNSDMPMFRESQATLTSASTCHLPQVPTCIPKILQKVSNPSPLSAITHYLSLQRNR
jgi:hypothetical protein